MTSGGGATSLRALSGERASSTGEAAASRESMTWRATYQIGSLRTSKGGRRWVRTTGPSLVRRTHPAAHRCPKSAEAILTCGYISHTWLDIGRIRSLLALGLALCGFQGAATSWPSIARPRSGCSGDAAVVVSGDARTTASSTSRSPVCSNRLCSNPPRLVKSGAWAGNCATVPAASQRTAAVRTCRPGRWGAWRPPR